MSTPFFNSPERLAALRAAADSWDGTPWAAGSGVKGARGGVCCHRLVTGILVDAGFPITQEEVPGGTLNRATHFPGSVMADWLRAHPDRFEEFPANPTTLQAGDLLTIRLGLGSHHIAIMADHLYVAHSWQGVGAHIGRIVEPKLLSRITHIFRPIEIP
jgi:cell wall-associated NlpC family hydrolase